MRRKFIIISLLLVFVSFLPAEQIVLKLVANVPITTIKQEDTFMLDNDERISRVSVHGAEEISKNFYRVISENVILSLTRI